MILKSITIFLLINVSVSKYEEGRIKTLEKWAFIARFCFLSNDGTFEYSIQYNKEYSVQNILLYYDAENQWPAVYKSNKTCEQREAVLERRLNQIIPLTESDLGSGCTERKVNATFVIQCHQARSFRSARERWWFLAVSNCNTTKGLDLSYRFLMTNGAPGDYWHEHFSADEFYILPILMGYIVIYMLLILAIIMCSMELKSRQLLHSTYKIFAASVYLQALGIFLQIIALIRFAFDGVGLPKLKLTGRIFEMFSEVFFLVVLLLMAKGYTITRGRLRMSSTAKLTIFVCLYIVTFITMFMYEQSFFDPGEVLYLYESPAGYGLIGLRIVAWWMFVYATVFTLKHYPEKGSFYYPFNLVGTMWFVTGPTFILTANTLIDKWVRESVVCALNHFVALAGHLLFLVLTVPSRANKNFPYHVRTTQIGVMELSDGYLGTNTLDNFGHHAYAPGGPSMPSQWRNVPVELFTIASTIHTESSVISSIRPLRRPNERHSQNLVIRPEEITTIAPSADPMIESPELELPGENLRNGTSAEPKNRS